MTDPFDVLHRPEVAVTPRAAFAADLKRQIELGLGHSPERNNAMQTSNLFYFTLSTKDAGKAQAFYSQLFGWELERSPSGLNISGISQPGGFNEDRNGIDGPALDPTVYISVPDIGEAVAKVRSLGGTAEEPVLYDSGWNATCTDDQGTRFCLSVPAEKYAHPPAYGNGHGDLFYWSLPVQDEAKARTFYSALLGWELGEAGPAGGMNVENMVTHGGVGAGREGHAPELFFRVADARGAADKVNELGGHAGELFESPEGIHVQCTDDQGQPFNISEPAEGY